MLARSAEALFTRLIDYAGLFPPASLSMSEAVRNYDAYRQGEHAWMLGRFVVPAAKLSEVPGDFPVSVLGLADADVIEVKAATAAEIEEIASQAEGKTVYVEIADPALLEPIARHRLRAKIRTGGITADAFPAAEAVAGFIRACAERGVPFKATAGLHHPLRCVKPLTYEPDAPRGTMHGFVNVFLAAALPAHAEEILLDDDPSLFVFDDDAVSWRGHSITTETMADIRRNFAISFGSCSFEEPIADLQELGWL